MKPVGSRGPGEADYSVGPRRSNDPSPAPGGKPLGRRPRDTLPDSRVCGADSEIGRYQATFSLPDGGGAHSPTSAELTTEATQVETPKQVRTLFAKIKELRPDEQQIMPLAQLIQRIRHIGLQGGNLTTLRGGLDQSILIARRGTDCSSIFAQIPHAVRLLDVNELGRGYRIARMPMSLKSFRANGESYGEYLADVADLLLNLPSVQLRNPRAVRGFSPTAEVISLFDEIDKVPAEHRMAALKRLCHGRQSLPDNAADIVISRTLKVMTGGELTTKQQFDIAGALISGIQMPDDRERFNREFDGIYQALLNLRQRPQARMSLLNRLLVDVDRISADYLPPGRKEKMQHSIERDLDVLSETLDVVHEVEAKLAEFRQDQPPRGLQTPLSQARVLADIPLVSGALPEINDEGPGTNPRFQCYLQLCDILRNETEASAPGVESPVLRRELLPMGDRGETLWLAHQRGLMARNGLRPEECKVVDRMDRHAWDVVGVFDELEMAGIHQRVQTISSLAAARFGLSSTPAVVTDRALQAASSDEFSAEQRLDIAAALVHGLRLIDPSDQRFVREIEAMRSAFLDQPTELQPRMLIKLATFLRRKPESLTAEGEAVLDAVENDLIRQRQMWSAK